jgi:hypothetical protein
VHYEPSARYVSAAAIDFAVTDFADEAVAEEKSVNGQKLASLLSAMDHELALYAYVPTAAATALHALSTVPTVDEITVFPAAATVLAVHECKFNPVPTSYVNCSPTIGHAMWNDDRPVCHADPPAPAPAVDMLQRPGQENADGDRCTVVQPRKRFRPDVQRFAPTLRDHADAGITESMAVDAAIIDPIPNAHADDVNHRWRRQVSRRNGRYRPHSDSKRYCPRLSPRRSLQPAVGLRHARVNCSRRTCVRRVRLTRYCSP